MMRKLLCVFLCVFMLAAMFPAAVFAEELEVLDETVATAEGELPSADNGETSATTETALDSSVDALSEEQAAAEDESGTEAEPPSYEMGSGEDLYLPVDGFAAEDLEDPQESRVIVDAGTENETELIYVDSFDEIEELPEGAERTKENSNYYTTAPDDDTPEDPSLIIVIWHKFLELIGLGEHTVDIEPADEEDPVDTQEEGQPHDAVFVVTESEDTASGGGNSGYYEDTSSGFTPDDTDETEDETEDEKKDDSTLPIPSGWNLKGSFRLSQSTVLSRDTVCILTVHVLENAEASDEALLFTVSGTEGKLMPLGAGFQTLVAADVMCIPLNPSPVNGQGSDNTTTGKGGSGELMLNSTIIPTDSSSSSDEAVSTGVSFVDATGQILGSSSAADGHAMLQPSDDGSTKVQVNTPSQYTGTAYGAIIDISN